LVCGLTQLAAHLMKQHSRELDRYCTNPVIAVLAALDAFFFQPNTANKADLAERWLENVELWIARDAEPNRGVS